MNKEELLAHANKMYPMGTKYAGAYGGSTVKGTLNYHNHSSGQMITDGHGGAVLHDNVWADVISYPEGFIPPEHIVTNFPIY